MPLSLAFPSAWLIRLLAPFEFGAQIVVLVFLLRYQSAEFLPRDVQHSLFDLKDFVGVAVDALFLE